VSQASPAATTGSRFSLRNSRTLRWTVSAGLAVMVAVGMVLLFLLTQATTNRDMYERNYTSLFVLNVVVAALLLLVILWIAYRLLARLRQRRFGSRLLVKLAAIFALAGFAPGLLIYVVSYQFVARSIESWFDDKKDTELLKLAAFVHTLLGQDDVRPLVRDPTAPAGKTASLSRSHVVTASASGMVSVP
jgi:nitrogen fixation/metabolism regulation signal transduction histidine kinase